MCQIDHENKKINTERLNIIVKAIVAVIAVIFGTFLVNLINADIQGRKLEQQKLLNEGQIRQTEMKYLGDYLKYALEDDIKKRIRFADYFKNLSISPELQAKWEAYYNGLVSIRDQEIKLKRQLVELRQTKNIEKTEAVKNKLDAIQSETTNLKTIPITITKELVYSELNQFIEQLKLYKPNTYERFITSAYISSILPILIQSDSTALGIVMREKLETGNPLKFLSSLPRPSECKIINAFGDNNFIIEFPSTSTFKIYLDSKERKVSSMHFKKAYDSTTWKTKLKLIYVYPQ